MDMKHLFDYYFGWTYAGVNTTQESIGGPKCVGFLSDAQKLLETIPIVGISCLLLYYACRHLNMPARTPVAKEKYNFSKNVILVIFCLTFGCELGFKFATQNMIWILNPCHVISAIQIYLLMAPATRFTLILFRVHMHLLHGGTLAILFPFVSTRLLTFEPEIYYIQHVLIMVVPLYLIYIGGVYTQEDLLDFTWPLLAHALCFLYHFIVLQGVGLFLQLNLNSMLCPAPLDPFYNEYYRLFACAHQTLLLLFHGKVYTLLSMLVFRYTRGPNEDKVK